MPRLEWGFSGSVTCPLHSDNQHASLASQRVGHLRPLATKCSQPCHSPLLPFVEAHVKLLSGYHMGGGCLNPPCHMPLSPSVRHFTGHVAGWMLPYAGGRSQNGVAVLFNPQEFASPLRAINPHSVHSSGWLGTWSLVSPVHCSLGLKAHHATPYPEPPHWALATPLRMPGKDMLG